MVETNNSIDLGLITKTNLILFDFINPMDLCLISKIFINIHIKRIYDIQIDHL